MYCSTALIRVQFLAFPSMYQSSFFTPSKVECESITVRDEFSSGEQQEEHYERWVDNIWPVS